MLSKKDFKFEYAFVNFMRVFALFKFFKSFKGLPHKVAKLEA